MKMHVIIGLIFIFSLAVPAGAQTNVSTGLNLSGYPQWVRDLRRAEIVAFGSFPFTFFLTSTIVDTVRCATNNWDMRYAPWPFKSAGAIDMTWNQQVLTISVAVTSSVVIALVDHIIVRVKRNKQQREILSQPPGTPIITRRPIDSDSGGGNSAVVTENP